MSKQCAPLHLRCRQVLRRERGESLISFLVALSLGAVLMGAATSATFDTLRSASQVRTMLSTQERTRITAERIAADLRMAGSGLPLSETANVAGSTEGAVFQPLAVADTTNSSIALRLNERGSETVLTSAWDSASGVVLSVVSTSNFRVGDTVYLTGATAGRAVALSGSIASLSAQSIRLASGAVVVPSASVFPAGSMLSPVQLVRYDIEQGTIRRNGVPMISDSTLFLEYLDSSNSALIPPLSTEQVRERLAAVRISIASEQDYPGRNSSARFRATWSLTAGLRNIALMRG